MNATRDECLSDGVVVTPGVGLLWHDDPLDPAACYDHNLTTFLLLDSLLDAPTGSESGERDNEAFQALEAKLDLLIQLVTRLLGQQQPLPPEQTVRLAASGIEWQSPTPLPPLGWLELFLEPRLPRALKLPVENRQDELEPGVWRICSRFAFLEEEIRAHLEKWVFRRHRREIAHQRQGRS
ncbi:PilZ domain-containing protein [Thiohalophilus sp.]|uniref:PilZ domain-containing protein n=1 Tax=Thiohalophilus sp. TaxID=3028392 RepID=UPI002ACEBB7D|nr:PilZ domain-containing protein [Thiohalophilus sp.]MDZ7802630.1 PilZ domain-containing protein [Thiohalophilus sp.]